MDIWSWVRERENQLREEGHERLAEIIDIIPSLTVDGEHDKVDALAPEGVALARGIKDQWLEIFIRHWHLQSLVLHRKQVKQSLPEAVSLLDFAHTGDNKECPQSVCVVQDLTNCYAHADGPGYVQERLDAASESLANIDPSWPCYGCIATEYAGALYDAGRYEEAIEFIDKSDKELVKWGEPKDTGHLLLTRVSSLLRMGRVKDAQKWLKKADNPYGGETFRIAVQIEQARVQAYLNHFDESKQALPLLETITASPADYLDWCETSYLLAKNNTINNDWQLCAQFEKLISIYIENGAVRDVIQMAQWACELALLRGQTHSAQYYADLIQSSIPNLNKILDAGEIHETLSKKVQAQLADAAAIQVPETVEEIEQWLDEDPENALAQINACIAKWPQVNSLVTTASGLYSQLGRHEAAIELLHQHLERQPDSAEIILHLGFELKHHKQRFQAFVEKLQACELSQDSHLNLLWVSALHHRQHGDADAAKSCLNEILQVDPGLYNTRQLLVRIEQEAENYQQALVQVEKLLEYHPEDKNLQWDIILFSTLLGDWERVRGAAEKLEMDLEGDGPEYEYWGYCRLQFTLDNGDKRIYYADRMGPVTARIRHVAHKDDPQQYNSLVVFNPAPLNTLDQKDENGNAVDSEGYDCNLYNALKVIEPGKYRTFTLDGVFPGDHNLEKISSALDEHDYIFNQRNSDDYTVYDDTTEKELPGLYAYVLIHDSAPLTDLNQLLEDITKDFEHPLSWLELAKAIGDEVLMAKHEEIQDRYYL